jgi:hypothetical protein
MGVWVVFFGIGLVWVRLLSEAAHLELSWEDLRWGWVNGGQ